MYYGEYISIPPPVQGGVSKCGKSLHMATNRAAIVDDETPDLQVTIKAGPTVVHPTQVHANVTLYEDKEHASSPDAAPKIQLCGPCP